MKSLISKVLPLKDWEEGFALAKSGEAIKVLLALRSLSGIIDSKNEGTASQAPKQMEVVEEAIKEPGEGQVLIRIDNFNLCGSDLRIYEGTYSGPMRYPIYVGHEWAGRVEAIGHGVKHLKAGDPVTGDCSLWCGTCPYCAHDKNLCEKIEKVGMTRDGASRPVLSSGCEICLSSRPDRSPGPLLSRTPLRGLSCRFQR